MKHSYETDEEYEKRIKKEEENSSNAGKIGLGIDISQGGIEPSVGIGGGLGIGLNGDITFNLF